MALNSILIPNAEDVTAVDQDLLDEQLTNYHGWSTDDLVEQHAKAGISMYGTDPRYPGEIVELAPDGQCFIVRRDGTAWVRVREAA